MTTHRPGSEQRTDLVAVLDCVTLPAIPTVYALHRPGDGVTDWVFALPGGGAIIVPSDDDGTTVIHTSMDLVVRRWARVQGADLVLVAA
ncbi:MAG: hypothetical protein ACRDTE_16715 [Pseudonocardiaceae bacterium]